MQKVLLLGGAVIGSLASVSAVGNAVNIVPFAEDQEVAMKVNGHSLSGVPEEYVAGRVTVRGNGASAAGGQLKFEIIKQPKWGQFGWNNSVSGEFIYSPRDYTLETTNHGVESLEPIPGCKYDCGGCPNTWDIDPDLTQLDFAPVADATCGPNGINPKDYPIPAAGVYDAAKPAGYIECDGEKTCCGGYRSTLLDANTQKPIPLATQTQKKWVEGYKCPAVGEAGGPTEKEIIDVKNADQSRTDDITVDDAVRSRVECKDVPPRLCVTHMAKVPRDEFKFRAMNDFGSSNWATVTIVFERVDSPAGFLQVVVLIGGILMMATCCGLLRVIALQFILQPYRRYELCGKFCAGFCMPEEDPFEDTRSADDYKPDFLKEGYEETENPIIQEDDE